MARILVRRFTTTINKDIDWSHLSGSLEAKELDFQEIPLIDITELRSHDITQRRMASQQIRNACSLVGFFYIKGHGVSKELIGQTFAESRRFFALPLDKKLEISCKNTPNRGYFNIGGENLGEKKVGDLKEGVDIGVDFDEMQTKGDKMRLPNRWPTNLPGWRETMCDYFAAMMKLSYELVHGIALSLNVKENWFDDKLKNPMASLRLTHYPAQKAEEVDSEHLGAGPHTDYGVLTILAQDNPGLQVRNRSGQWISVTPIPDTFVVNLADMMPRWTNGYFQSTPHRVINVTTRRHTTPSRYSIPFFFEPDYDALIECIPSYYSDKNPVKYPPKVFGQHLKELYQKTY